jgi:hypothetical protein
MCLGRMLVLFSPCVCCVGIWLSLGGFQEAIHENKKMIYNTHVVIPPTGELKEEYCYRKVSSLYISAIAI